ncbi:hypothetical protein K469DRAFT_575994, partial [Zopfia rhizophila CBS 207.26]
ITLYIEGISNSRIREATGLRRSIIKDIIKEAKVRGYNPKVSKTIIIAYIINKLCSRHLCKRDKEI